MKELVERNKKTSSIYAEIVTDGDTQRLQKWCSFSGEVPSFVVHKPPENV